MALINCLECKHEVSSKAKSCPNCGYVDNSKRNLLLTFYGSLCVAVLTFIDANTFITWPLFSAHRSMVGNDDYLIAYWKIQAAVMVLALVCLLISSGSLLFIRIKAFIRG